MAIKSAITRASQKSCDLVLEKYVFFFERTFRSFRRIIHLLCIKKSRCAQFCIILLRLMQSCMKYIYYICCNIEISTILQAYLRRWEFTKTPVIFLSHEVKSMYFLGLHFKKSFYIDFLLLRVSSLLLQV